MTNKQIVKVGYVVPNLKQIGPTNQTLSIIRYSHSVNRCVVITLFDETNDTLIQDYQKYGIKIVQLHLKKSSAFLFGKGKLVSTLRKERITLIHSWGTIPDILSHFASIKDGIAHIITLRNFPKEDILLRMPNLIGKVTTQVDLHILKNTKFVVACSNSIRDKMNSTYGWSNITSIQNGVDIDKYVLSNREEARRALNVDATDIIFIATGSMISRKRISETAEAFINAHLPSNYKLWFLGSGSLLENMKSRYARKNIIFWGKQQDVVRFLNAADIFVSSSESEGMPNAVLEALACKVPVYLSDIPQHIEVLNEVPNSGKLYPLGNIGRLSDLFDETSTEDISVMRKMAGCIQESSLTMKNMGRKYEEYYNDVVDRT